MPYQCWSVAKCSNNKDTNIQTGKYYTYCRFHGKRGTGLFKSCTKQWAGFRLNINEIKEVLVQLYAYAGFPRSLNAINTLQAVLNERKQKGIKDTEGPLPGKLTSGKTKFQQGKDVQTKLTGTTAIGAPQRFVPVIYTFLKEHLFADIFGRNNLDYQSREIATISALVSMSGVEAQLLSHIRVGINVGLTAGQLNDLATTLHHRVGWMEGARARNSIEQVLPAGANNNTNSNTVITETLFPKGEKIINNNFTGNV